MSDWAFETKQIHAGQNPDSEMGARALPIYQTTSFVFYDAQVAADRFALTDLGPIYTRRDALLDRRMAREQAAAAIVALAGFELAQEQLLQ